MDDAIAVVDRIIAALEDVGTAILDNWGSFLVLACALVGLTIFCCHLLYSRKEKEVEHQRNALNDRSAALDVREKNIKRREDAAQELQEEFECMKQELSSPSYQLYKAKCMSEALDETNLFQKVQ